MSFVLQPFSFGDLPETLRLEERVFSEDAFDWEMFLELYHSGPDTFFIARDSDESDDSEADVIGYVCGYMQHDHGGYIASIAVHPSAQRTGLGTALLEKITAVFAAKGAGYLVLHVKTTNDSAITFYEKHGFARLRTVARYYGDGSSAHVMRAAIRADQ